MLEVYKDQGVSVERGFRFLKDPMFYAESLYLKSLKRIMALLMVMTLSLLLYTRRGSQSVTNVMNVREEHRIVLRALGSAYEKM